jgi:hypothetical protein
MYELNKMPRRGGKVLHTRTVPMLYSNVRTTSKAPPTTDVVRLKMFNDNTHYVGGVTAGVFEQYKSRARSDSVLNKHLTTHRARYERIYERGLVECQLVQNRLMVTKKVLPFHRLLNVSNGVATTEDKVCLVSMIVPPNATMPPFVVTKSTRGGATLLTTNANVPPFVVTKSTRGGATLLTGDQRREVYSVTIPDFKEDAGMNYGHFVMKVVANESDKEQMDELYEIAGTMRNSFVSNYVHEAMVYKTFASRFEGMKAHTKFDRSNVVMLYDSPDKEFEESTSVHFRGKHIMDIKIPFEGQSGFYLLLENTYDYRDFSDMVQYWHANGSTPLVYKGLNQIINTMYYANNLTSFVHGDLHMDNVKINQDATHVKLFDFDYSAHMSFNEKGSTELNTSYKESPHWGLTDFKLTMLNPMKSVETQTQDSIVGKIEREVMVSRDDLYDGKLTVTEYTQKLDLRDNEMNIHTTPLFIKIHHPSKYMDYFKLYFLIHDVYRIIISTFYTGFPVDTELSRMFFDERKDLEQQLSDFFSNIHACGSSWYNEDRSVLFQAMFDYTVDQAPKSFVKSWRVNSFNTLSSGSAFYLFHNSSKKYNLNIIDKYRKLDQEGGYYKKGKYKVMIGGKYVPRTIYTKGNSSYLRDQKRNYIKIQKKAYQ